MRIPYLIVSALALYSLIGVCPMQVSSMIMMNMGEGMMDMGSNMMEMNHEGEMLSQNTGACEYCFMAVDNFAIKDVVQFSFDFDPIQKLGILASFFDDIKLDDGSSVLTQLARAGPVSAAPDITQTIVFLT